jgi:hypothetical protein
MPEYDSHSSASSRQRRRKALDLDLPRTLLPRVDDVYGLTCQTQAQQ